MNEGIKMSDSGLVRVVLDAVGGKIVEAIGIIDFGHRFDEIDLFVFDHLYAKLLYLFKFVFGVGDILAIAPIKVEDDAVGLEVRFQKGGKQFQFSVARGGNLIAVGNGGMGHQHGIIDKRLDGFSHKLHRGAFQIKGKFVFEKVL